MGQGVSGRADRSVHGSSVSYGRRDILALGSGLSRSPAQPNLDLARDFVSYCSQGHEHPHPAHIIPGQPIPGQAQAHVYIKSPGVTAPKEEERETRRHSAIRGLPSSSADSIRRVLLLMSRGRRSRAWLGP